ELAGELHAKVTLGQDPAQEKREAVAKSSDTFGNLVQRYLDQRRGDFRVSTITAKARYLEMHCAPLHRLPLESLDRKRIAALLTDVEKTRGPVSANRLRAALAAMFAWAMREGLAESNPVIGTSQRQEKSRDRVLSPAELRSIWRAAPDNQYGTVVRLLMLSGQRYGEVAGLRWSEIDFDKGLISLPGDR